MTLLPLVALCYASASIVFESFADQLSSTTLHAYLKISDYKSLLKRVMMRTGIFEDYRGEDLIEEMRMLIGSETRLDAINHFFERNDPEIDETLNAIIDEENEIVFIAAVAKPAVFRKVFEPITRLVRLYIKGKRQMCMYDYLPIGLRNMDEFLNVFHSVHPTTYPVTSFSRKGHLTMVTDDAETHEQTIMIQSHVMKYTVNGHERLIDVRNGCAVDVKPNFSVFLVPSERFFIVQDSDTVLAWTSDSATATVLPVKKGYAISSLKNVSRLGTRDKTAAVIVSTTNQDSSSFLKLSLKDKSLLRRSSKMESLIPPGYKAIDYHSSVLVEKSVGKHTLIFSKVAYSVLEAVREVLPSLHTLPLAVTPGHSLSSLMLYIDLDDQVQAWREIENMNLIGRVRDLFALNRQTGFHNKTQMVGAISDVFACMLGIDRKAVLLAGILAKMGELLV